MMTFGVFFLLMEFVSSMVMQSDEPEPELEWKRTLKEWVKTADTYIAVSDKLRDTMGQVFRTKQQLQQNEVSQSNISSNTSLI